MVLRQVSVDKKHPYGEVQTIEFNVLVKPDSLTQVKKHVKIIEELENF